MKVLPVVVVAILVIIAMLASVLYLLLQSGSRAELKSLVSAPRTAVPGDALLRSIKALDRSVARLSTEVSRLREELSMPAKPDKGAPGAPRATEPRPMKGITGLTKAIQSLEQSLRSTPSTGSGPSSGLRRALEQSVNLQPPEFETHWTSEEDATRALRFKTYGQVLKQVGPPSRMYPSTNSMNWEYPTFRVIFCDGFVYAVHSL
jgi:hypothetical protein